MTTRREFIAGATATLSLATPTASFAQTALRQDQRDGYARAFQSAGASSQELQILRDIQERRATLPSGLKAVEEFLANSPSMKALTAGATPQLGMFVQWHDVALEASALDHTTEAPVAPPTFGEQLGPTRASRALAIVHLAMYEATNVIYRKYKSYRGTQQTILAAVGLPENQVSPATASVQRAIIESAHGTLVELYPNKRSLFDSLRTRTLSLVGDSPALQDVGQRIGMEAAKAILDLRRSDGSERPDLSADDFNSSNPLDWHKDPISQVPLALGGNWHRVKPFVISSADKHRPPAPPTIGSAPFTDAYKQVKRLGGDPNAPTQAPRWPTPTQRTGADGKGPYDDKNETFKGIFWGYDGTALLCAPPRLYNMITTSIAFKERPVTQVIDLARLMMLVNVAMADAGIAAWEAKFHYAYARPVTTLRAADADNTAEGRRDHNWTPLGAPVTNGTLAGRNLTPPFPSYPSGHATFGGALFQVLRGFWKDAGGNNIPFEFVSDEYNGVNRGPGDAEPRPEVKKAYKTLSEAETENAMSRIWLGIHWIFDATAGIDQGKKVADDVLASL